MKQINGIGRGLLAAGLLAASVGWGAQQATRQSAAGGDDVRAKMRELQQEPASVGKSLPGPVRSTLETVQWGEGPPSLPPGAQMAVVEGDPAEADRLFTFWLKLPPGYRIGPHFHPVDEHVTVLSGEFRVAMGERFEEQALQGLPAGSFIAMPKGHPHFVRVTQETVIQLHGLGPWAIFYVDPADDPRRGVGGAGEEPGR